MTKLYFVFEVGSPELSETRLCQVSGRDSGIASRKAETWYKKYALRKCNLEIRRRDIKTTFLYAAATADECDLFLHGVYFGQKFKGSSG